MESIALQSDSNMEGKIGTQSKNTIDKNILDLFWRLCEKDSDIRIKTCADILHVIWKKQQEIENQNVLSSDLEYCIERLLKGLASPRDAARLGYTLLLTEILKKFHIVKIEEVIELMKKHLTLINKQDKRDIIFGQLFAYTAIIRSGRLSDHTCLSYVILSLFDLCSGKHYILNATYEILLNIFSQLTNENFKNVWSELKKKLPSDWETCSADSLWLLLLCIRLFPDVIKTKYLRNHWGSDDIFASDNLNHIRRIIKQTTSCLPILHPMCTEFLLLVKQRKDFSEIWNAVVDENLFDHEQSEKAYVGFEMIKLTLQDVPTKKLLKIVLSPKFRTMFSKSFLTARHPMNRAACYLADFFCNFVKNNKNSDLQIIILETFLQPAGTVLLDQIAKKKEVSLMIQNLLPDAVKSFCSILKTVLLKNQSNDNEKKLNNVQCSKAVHMIANLVMHPVMLADVEWRTDIMKSLFLYSFFTVKKPTSEIAHCENSFEPLSDIMRDVCATEFFRSVNSLHMRSENQHQSYSNLLEQLLSLIDYAETLINASENVEPNFSVEKIQDTWHHLKTIVHKLSKQSKKDGLVNQSIAFQALFLELGFHLFQDPDYIHEILEELYICCKKSLKFRKHDADKDIDEESEPPWIGVVVDIFLSLLSKSSKHLRSLVMHIFPLFCPFIDQNALQQILDVVNPKKQDEDMLVDESDSEEENDVDFDSGSSSDELDEEVDDQPVDEQFKKKIQEALGPAADKGDDESVVLSDSEMFKLDSALSAVFKSRKKSGHTQMQSEDKTLLDFRTRCLDLIVVYLRSEPPMQMVLTCVEPILAAYEFGHHSKNQAPLLNRAVTVLKFMTKIRKFKDHNNVSKSDLKQLLDALIPKCHKETNLTISQDLSSLCVFIVLCYRKLEKSDSPNKKTNSKLSHYIKAYLSALETFVTSGSSHMPPHFFALLMEACPDLAWHFVEPCKNYAFSSTVRLFKKTQCLGLLLESLKYSKSQKDIADDLWLELANSIFPSVIESLKNTLENSNVKQVYCSEHLNVIYTLYLIIKEKTGQSILEKYAELLPLLTNNTLQKLSVKGKGLRNRLVRCLGGNVNKSKKNQVQGEENNVIEDESNNKRKSIETVDCSEDCVNGDVSNQSPKKLRKKQKKGELSTVSNNVDESLSSR